MSIIRTENLTKCYRSQGKETAALKNINITIEQGEFVGIVGQSGSGKSTLLNMLGGLDVPTSGRVLLKEKDITVLTEEEKTIFRREHIGFVFQSYNLIEALTVYENITVPLGLGGKVVDQRFLSRIVCLLGLQEKMDRFPNQLSGGQQQRVAIARALITKPVVILADEPTGNLDEYNSNEVVKLLKNSGKELNQTIIMVTHSPALASMTDRVIEIEEGMVKNGE